MGYTRVNDCKRTLIKHLLKEQIIKLKILLCNLAKQKLNLWMNRNLCDKNLEYKIENFAPRSYGSKKMEPIDEQETLHDR